MTLALYHYIGCPYCARVRSFLDQTSIRVTMKDIHANPAFRDELVKIGGRAQVPCLVVDGKALYESADIIDWFKNKYDPSGNQTKN